MRLLPPLWEALLLRIRVTIIACLIPSSKYKFQTGCVPGIDTLADFLLEVSGGILQTVNAKVLFCFVSHHRHVDFCLPHIRENLHKRHGDVIECADP